MGTPSHLDGNAFIIEMGTVAQKTTKIISTYRDSKKFIGSVLYFVDVIPFLLFIVSFYLPCFFYKYV